MRSPVGWVLPAVAGVATVVAIAASADPAVAVVAGAVAVAAASLLIVEAWSQRADPERPVPAPPRSELDRLRSAFHSGRIGREDVAIVLNRLERRFRDPNVGLPTPAELAELAELSPAAFRRYVRDRLDRLEAGP